MQRYQKILKNILSLVLVFILTATGLFGVAGTAYAQANPAAVNQGKTDEEITADDLEQFSQREGFDYHEATTDEYVPGEIIVEIVSSTGTKASALQSYEKEFDLELVRMLEVNKFAQTDKKGARSASLSGGSQILTSYLMETDEEDIITLCDKLNEREDVFNAQPNFLYSICDEEESVDMSASDNDMPDFTDPPAFDTSDYQNHLKWWFDYCNISTAWETADYGTHSQDYGLGKGIKVAVIDTGCNTAHEDIVDNLFDDGKGHCGYYADKETYITKNDATNDTSGHGSHCCGTIAMNGKNNVGGIGTAPECQLIVLKADRNDGNGFAGSDIKTSLLKAREFGADIISMSLGSYGFDYTLYRTYQEVSSSCLIVCAAGNDAFDTTQKLHFPSAASCVIGVMALGSSSARDRLASFSNYDTTGNFYKVAAPGTAIWSLDCKGNNLYKNLQGTSMATPAAAGMMACFMSYIRNVKGYNWTPAQYQYKIESIITNGTYNSLYCEAYSQSVHPVAYEKDSKFRVMNLKALFDKYSAYSFSTTAVTFTNSTIKDGVTNATGLAASALDSCAMRRVSLLYWSSESTRKGISDYSDLTKLTGLNYLDLSGNTKITSSTIADVISKCPATVVHLDLSTSAKLGDLSCLAASKFPCLHYLNISSNNLTTLAPIQKFTSLKTLIASSNSIKDISPLSGMKYLEKLDLNNNLIEDPNPAFASDFANYIDLSHNKLSDHMQLYNYHGAYHDSDFNSKTITFNVSYNNMTGLTSAIANTIKTKIEDKNVLGTEIVDGETVVVKATVTFTYNNQTAPANTVPMTSFRLTAKPSVSRETICSKGTLNIYDVTGFTAYPSGANQYNYLSWSCSEEGYFSSDGTVLFTPDQITSTRTLTLTGTAPAASGATSKVSGKAYQTIKLTITAPEIFNAYLSDRVVKTGSDVYIAISTNTDCSRLYLRSGTGTSATTYCYFPMDTVTTLKASDQSKCVLYKVPDDITGTAGNYPLYLYAADSSGNYTIGTKTDITGRTSYPYKSLGTLYVKDSVTNSTDTLNITGDTKVNRYGQAGVFAVNSGTGSSSPAKPSGDLSVSISNGSQNYVGGISFNATLAAGFTGNSNTNISYPSKNTGTIKYKFTMGGVSKEFTIESVAPEVKNVEIRNNNTYKSDGYVEYLVKTNTAASQLRAYAVGTTKNLANDNGTNLIFTAFNDTQGYYGNYNASYSHKLWSIKVPLASDSSMQAVTLTANDALGDGSVTMTPATGIIFPNAIYFYPGENTYQYLSDSISLLPLDSSGNSLANCCKSVTYTSSNTEYFTLSGSKLSVKDMKSTLSGLENTSTDFRSTTITAKLQSGATATKTAYIYRPVTYTPVVDTDRSQYVRGGTVYYTAKTYGADTLYVRNVSDKYSTPLLTLTKEDPDCYTEGTDEKGTYTTWSFERQFEDSTETSIKTYVRASYRVDDEFTSNSSTYSYKYVSRPVAVGNYEQWEAQTARITDEVLASLSAAYGDDTQTYNERLSAYNDALANANLSYTEKQQANIDAQTDALAAIIDVLLGYSDYEEAMEQYNDLQNSNNAVYIDNNLLTLVSTQADDTNCLTLANGIKQKIADILALVNAIESAQALLNQISNDIPEITTDVSAPGAYGADSYTALKAAFDYLRTNLENRAYRNVDAVNQDVAALAQAAGALHTHQFELTHQLPLDKIAGYVYFYCSGCGESYSAVYDSQSEQYSLGVRCEDPAQAGQTNILPAPAFNVFSTDTCDYSAHAGSLRLSESDDYSDFNTTQGLRFTASMHVPAGVSYTIGDNGNCVRDIGFVYSQTARIGNDINNLALDAADVYSISVSQKNGGTVFDGTNWNGVSYHSDENTLTYNIVINVKAQNWEEDYCARAYVTYAYNGQLFTIYDNGFSSKSVAFIANEVVNSAAETQEAKDFCLHKILNNL